MGFGHLLRSNGMIYLGTKAWSRIAREIGTKSGNTKQILEMQWKSSYLIKQ